jgi:hypothetical protein
VTWNQQWVAFRFGNGIIIHSMDQLLKHSSARDINVSQTNSSDPTPHQHSFRFQIPHTSLPRGAYSLAAIWLTDEYTSMTTKSLRCYGYWLCGIVPMERNDHQSYVVLCNGYDGSVIRQWSSPSFIGSQLDYSPYHDSYFSVSILNQQCNTKGIATWRTEAWSIAEAIKPISGDENHDNGNKGSPVLSGEQIVVWREDQQIVCNGSMPRLIWISSNLIVHVVDRSLSFVTLQHASDTLNSIDHNGKLSIEIKHDDTITSTMKWQSSIVPYLQCQLDRVPHRPFIIQSSLVPYDYLCAASEWIEASINTSLDSSCTFPMGVLAIIYSYYFD